MATVSQFRARDPYGAFAALTDPQIQTALDDAALALNQTAWGTAYDRAHVLYAQHSLAIAERGGASGPATSVTVDGVTNSWAAPAASSSSLLSTSYGQQLDALAAALGVAGPSAIVGDILPPGIPWGIV